MNVRASVVDEIRTLFALRGEAAYLGEAVTQLEHALQCAWLAERASVAPPLVAAALLHDVGHLLQDLGEDAAERGVDGHHEALGARFLAARFGDEVVRPVALHVAAKRYLCATRPEYAAGLSAASHLSLALQGGAMNTAEAERFAGQQHADAALALRRWDDAAKVVGLLTPGLDHFLPVVQRCATEPVRS